MGTPSVSEFQSERQRIVMERKLQKLCRDCLVEDDCANPLSCEKYKAIMQRFCYNGKPESK